MRLLRYYLITFEFNFTLNFTQLHLSISCDCVNNQARIVSKVNPEVSVSWRAALWQDFVSLLHLIAAIISFVFLYYFWQ